MQISGKKKIQLSLLKCKLHFKLDASCTSPWLLHSSSWDSRVLTGHGASSHLILLGRGAGTVECQGNSAIAGLFWRSQVSVAQRKEPLWQTMHFPARLPPSQLCVVRGVSLLQPHFLTRCGDQMSQKCYFEVNNYWFCIS